MNHTQWPSNILHGHKICQQFPFQGPPKYTQIGIFGSKINHLATLFESKINENGKRISGVETIESSNPDT
jgi:hypothetical protein